MESLTEYEVMRQVRMKENQDRMQGLGLVSCLEEVRRQAISHKTVKGKRDEAPASDIDVQRRRSTRQQGVKAEAPTRYLKRRSASKFLSVNFKCCIGDTQVGAR